MSIILLINQEIPEKGLTEKKTYKLHLSPNQKEQFIRELEEEGISLDGWKTTMHLLVEMKKYKD